MLALPVDAQTLSISHAASTWALVGLTWIVQLVIYPQFSDIGSHFKSYHRNYTQRITLVVLPLMGTELITAILLTLYPGKISMLQSGIGLALVLIVWALTGLLAVPLHYRLENGFDTKLHKALLHVHWFRTVIWSIRGAMVASWLCTVLGHP
mmetsp:Transcript_127330/g.207252  ORF Transcript_127330/g.207252 Transcript_127330/m.207252 type:complete len:152 (+) Transcript_127330:45-500(+)